MVKKYQAPHGTYIDDTGKTVEMKSKWGGRPGISNPDKATIDKLYPVDEAWVRQHGKKSQKKRLGLE